MMRRSLATVLVLAAACDQASPHPWTEADGYRWRELTVRGGAAGFEQVAGRSSGIDFQNTVSDSILLGNRYLGQGAGVALGDVDGDGLPDVFLARTQGCNGLYRNLGGWKFEDITQQAGVGACDRYSTGAAFADVDGDGDLDLITLATRGPNAIFVNDGNGHFTERRDLGLDPEGRGGTTLTLGDTDGDGWLDLYVANYKPFSLDDSLPPQQHSFNQMVRKVGEDKYEIVPERRNDYKVVMRPDMGGLKMTARAAPDDFYANRNGVFTRVPMTGGRFLDAAGKRLAEPDESFGLAARFVDLNGDRAPELYVGNDFEDTDELWLNDGRGGFRRAGWTAQRQMSNSTMGLDVGDVNGDGMPDFFEVDMLSNDTRRLKTQIPTHTPIPKQPGTDSIVLQQQRNALFVNRGDGTFAEVGMAAGVSASGWSWGTTFIDADLDGWQDILVANGHLWDVMDADVQERLQNRLTSIPWQRLRWEFPVLKLRNVAFRNRGDLTFEDVGAKWGFGTEEDISHGIATADLDGDGDQDVVVNRLNAPALVLRNKSNASRISVRLVGDAPNTRGVGAKISLLGGATPVQVHEVAAGGLYLSHSDYEATFAMGKSDSATLVVDWRDGRQTRIEGIRPNREYEVKQASAVPAQGTPVTEAQTLFRDVSAELGGHRHVENAFDDWDRQYLLPNALSTLGPGVAWFDLDRDGDEDLIVGAGKGGRIAIFRNDRGRFTPVAGGDVLPTDAAGIVAFASAAGSQVLVGLSNWESRTIAELRAAPAVAGLRAGGSAGAALTARRDTVVPAQEASTGPLALADYDGDGDLDLFVGGRAISMQYPVDAASLLLRNEGGRFVVDQENSARLAKIGMVSAAVFADVNGDGHDDLLLAREWNSIALFLNDGHGRFSLAPDSWGLARWTGRWNGIATGDLDGDGRLDIVATSWGRNTMLQADSARPLVLVHGPFGARQEEEMLVARRDPRIKGLAPLTSYARARVAIPSLAERVPTFAAYADATVEDVLKGTAAPVQRRQAVTLDQMVFLNRGDHFEAVAMPMEAQLAPAFYAGVADFNGDGHEDVALSQNFAATEIGAPRYDAGRGLLLLGDGKGGLRPFTNESGLVVWGDQRGAAYGDFDGDGRLDLVVSQNGSGTKLFRNQSAKPGLRVRLRGPAGNPDGVGAQVRVVYGNTMGPVREVQAGSGYWSQNGAVQVMGLSGEATEVWVRWPGGGETRLAVAAGAREVVVVSPAASR